VPVVGPAGADRTASAAAVVASGNYWTPGPWRSRTVRLVGTRTGRRGKARRSPGVTTRLGIEHRRSRLIVNSNTFAFSERPAVGCPSSGRQPLGIARCSSMSRHSCALRMPCDAQCPCRTSRLVGGPAAVVRHCSRHFSIRRPTSITAASFSQLYAERTQAVQGLYTFVGWVSGRTVTPRT